MTSNVANEEIASHALKLRREAEIAKQHRGTTGSSISSSRVKDYFILQLFLHRSSRENFRNQ